MSKIKSKDTQPELRVRKLLFSHGFRFRLHRKDLPGKPDIILPKYNTAIFVHGCYWHGHECKIGSGLRKPKTNRDYWIPKISKNIERDKENQKRLSEEGWNVITIWECETKYEDKLLLKLKPLFEKKENNKKPNICEL